MVARVVTVAFEGVEARRVEVEAQITPVRGEPHFIIVLERPINLSFVGHRKGVSDYSCVWQSARELPTYRARVALGDEVTRYGAFMTNSRLQA